MPDEPEALDDPFNTTPDGMPIMGRFVDVHVPATKQGADPQQRPVYAADCLPVDCFETLKFRSRFEDFVQVTQKNKGGGIDVIQRPVYITAPPDSCMGYDDPVVTDCEGNPTKTMHLFFDVVRWEGNSAHCGAPGCEKVTLTHSGGGAGADVWTGILSFPSGDLLFELTCPDGVFPQTWTLNNSGCGKVYDELGNPPSHSKAQCQDPFSLLWTSSVTFFQTTNGVETCCQLSHDIGYAEVNIRIWAACGFVKEGRLTDVIFDNRPVYAVADECPRFGTVAPGCCERWPEDLIVTVESDDTPCVDGLVVPVEWAGITPIAGGLGGLGTWVGTDPVACSGEIRITVFCGAQTSSSSQSFECAGEGDVRCAPQNYSRCSDPTYGAGFAQVGIGCGDPGDASPETWNTYVCAICNCNGAGEPIDFVTVDGYTQQKLPGCPEFGAFTGETHDITFHVTQ